MKLENNNNTPESLEKDTIKLSLNRSLILWLVSVWDREYIS